MFSARMLFILFALFMPGKALAEVMSDYIKIVLKIGIEVHGISYFLRREGSVMFA
jgi:hypothetical protein